MNNCEFSQNKFEYFSLILFESNFKNRNSLIFDKINFIENFQQQKTFNSPLLPIFSMFGCYYLNITNLYFKYNEIGIENIIIFSFLKLIETILAFLFI